MAILEREFYRSARGPHPADLDIWRLVLDLDDTGDIVVRHEWQTARDSGFDHFTLVEFLAEDSAERDALVALLFGTTASAAERPKNPEMAGELAV